MAEVAETKKEPWYFRASVIVIALLSVGPLALPLVWGHPRWSMIIKTAVTAAILIATYFLWEATSRSLKSLSEYFQMLS